MTREQIIEQIKAKKSFLCIGLDIDLDKLPESVIDQSMPLQLMEKIFNINKAYIDATNDLAIAYKPNLAFYESFGWQGWRAFELTVKYLNTAYPEIFIIADAKRGDIGNTSTKYAEAFFKNLRCDALTVAPYMGEDSVAPFLAFPGKWAIVLALTSNKGSDDFQNLEINDPIDERLYKKVLRKSKAWGTPENMMYVVGATKAEKLKVIRDIVPDHFLLIPGVGAQGGSLEEVAENGMTEDCGLIVNSSREILYAWSAKDAPKDVNFVQAARLKAEETQAKMAALLEKKGIV